MHVAPALAWALVVVMLSSVLPLSAQDSSGQKVMSPPRIMVVPSEVYCTSHGYTYTFQGQNGPENRPDYRRAIMEDTDLHPVLSQIKELIMERNSKIKIIDLLTTVQNLETDQVMNLLNLADESESADEAIVRSSDADVLIKVNFDVIKTGPQRQVQFTITGTDAYTGQEFAPVSGIGSPSTYANAAVLVREAIYGKMDDFLRMVLQFYANMMTDGRAVSLYFKIQEGSDYQMTSLVSQYSLADEIDDLVLDNSQNGIGADQCQVGRTFAHYPAVHIPLMGEVRGRQRRQNALGVAQCIATQLEQFDLTCTCKQAGLGKVYIYIQ